MAEFERYAPLLKELEGGFVEHPADPGGATNMGVTLKIYRSFFGQNKTVGDLRRITDAEWSRIMKTGYWDKCLADGIGNQSVAEIFVDWAVNSGPATAIRRVQEIAGTRPDGCAGPKTIAAINASNPEELFIRIKDARIQYYRKLVVSRPEMGVFLKGWLNRVDKFTFKK